MENQCRGTNLAVVDCTFSTENWLATDNFYTCSGTIVGSGREGSILDVTGEHEGGLTNEDVNALSIINQRALERIPTSLQNFFPNLFAIEWKFGDLAVISAADLEHFANLTIFSVYGNRLVTLPGNLLMNSRIIRHIDFGSNSINHVGQTFISGTASLEVALFERNNCISFSAGTPSELSTLTSLLQDWCPPLPEPEPEPECPASCVERIDYLEQRIRLLEEALLSVMARIQI